MPHDAVSQLRRLAQGEARADPDNISNLALFHAILGVSDVLERIAQRQDKADAKLEDIGTSVHNVDKRISLLERDEVSKEIDDLKARVTTLEHDRTERTGARKAIDALVKYGPIIVVLVSALIILERVKVL